MLIGVMHNVCAWFDSFKLLYGDRWCDFACEEHLLDACLPQQMSMMLACEENIQILLLSRLCIAIWLALATIASFYLHLTLMAQTTILFCAN